MLPNLSNIDPAWLAIFEQEWQQDYFKKLLSFLTSEREHKVIIYPPKEKIYRAFELCSYDSVRVVIVGQDPYHGEGQADGLAFSVPKGQKIPPSLRNIFKERKNDLGIEIPDNGDLSDWARQGVLLLNTSLTVEAGKANAHKRKGWIQFTDAILSALSHQKEHLVFILWGREAQQKKQLIDEKKHLIIESAHPSPLGAYKGFFDSHPFSKTNNYLIENGQRPIQW